MNKILISILLISQFYIDQTIARDSTSNKKSKPKATILGKSENFRKIKGTPKKHSYSHINRFSDESLQSFHENKKSEQSLTLSLPKHQKPSKNLQKPTTILNDLYMKTNDQKHEETLVKINSKIDTKNKTKSNPKMPSSFKVKSSTSERVDSHD